MADGAHYLDTRAPFIASDAAAVTLATTAKALVTPSFMPVLGAGYMNGVGKKIRVRMAGRITTVLTPGNGSFDIYWGTGADANGVLLATSGTFALVASQTNLAWQIEIYIHCRSTGSAGTLFAMGRAEFNTAVVAAGGVMVPSSAPVVSGAVDLTAALIPSIQFKRSGSTAETMQVHDLEVVAFGPGS